MVVWSKVGGATEVEVRRRGWAEGGGNGAVMGLVAHHVEPERTGAGVRYRAVFEWRSLRGG